MRIIDGNLDDPRVIDLLQIHLTSARAQTAPGSAHAGDGLRLAIAADDIWIERGLPHQAVRYYAALIDAPDVTAHAMRGKGAGGAMLRHIIAAAKAAGISRLSLETGSWAYFDPARRLYSKHGFVECPPFADYVLDPNSVFMSLELK